MSSYFFWDEPKQFFVGAELCARWFQVLKGDSKPVKSIISYSQEAQEVFALIYAGRALSTLSGRVTRWEWDRRTIGAFADFLAQLSTCGGSVLGKVLPSKMGRFDVSMIKNVSKSVGYIVVARSISSLVLRVLTTAFYIGAQTYVLPRVLLVVDTMAFMAKLVGYCIKYQPNQKASN